MKNEIFYLGYLILATCGSYYIENFKTAYRTLKEAKEAVEFITDQELYYQ